MTAKEKGRGTIRGASPALSLGKNGNGSNAMGQGVRPSLKKVVLPAGTLSRHAIKNPSGKSEIGTTDWGRFCDHHKAIRAGDFVAANACQSGGLLHFCRAVLLLLGHRWKQPEEPNFGSRNMPGQTARFGA